MKNKQETFNEKWEQQFILIVLFLFIILGVLFIAFIVPTINPNFLLSNSSSEENTSVVTEGPTESSSKSFSIGIKYSDSMNYSQALNYFEKALEQEPENIDYLNEVALTHYKLKNYDESIKKYDILLSIDKDNASSYYNRIGNIYWIKKDYDRAESYFTMAIENNPKESIAYNNLALMYYEQDKQQDAINILNQGISTTGSEELKDTLILVEG